MTTEAPSTDESKAKAGAAAQNHVGGSAGKKDESGHSTSTVATLVSQVGNIIDFGRRGVINLPPIPEQATATECFKAFEKTNHLYVIRDLNENYNEQTSHYKICNSNGQIFMIAGLTSNFNCLHKSIRPFIATIISKKEEPFIIIKRPNCLKYFWNITHERVHVYFTPNNYIGSVKQISSMMSPKFKICVPNGKRIFKLLIIEDVDAVWEIWSSSTKFKIHDNRNNLIGTIFKIKRNFTDDERTISGGFKVHFLHELESICKALIMASGFLIECMYFGK